jgi:pimeloyl-ACP methyl ester carboxylesterase
VPTTSAPLTLRVNGYDMTYVEAGSGKPLLLVHGSLCDYRFWRPQMEPLATGRRVIAVSLRHYWPESWDGSGAGFSPQQHADDLAVFIDALGTGPVDLVGHSRGGTVAWLLARQHPELLRSLVFAEPGLGIGTMSGEQAADLDRSGFRRRSLTLLQGGNADGALELFIDTVSGGGTWARMVPWLKRMMRDNANTLFGQVAETYATVTAATAATLRLPLLLVGGAQSPAPYPAVLEAFAALLPGAQRATIASASHAMNLWNAPAFNQALESFLAAR